MFPCFLRLATGIRSLVPLSVWLLQITKATFFFFSRGDKTDSTSFEKQIAKSCSEKRKNRKKKRLCSIETNWEGTQCLPPRSHARLTPHIPRSATPDCSLTGPEPAPYYALIGAGNLRAGPDHTLAN